VLADARARPVVVRGAGVGRAGGAAVDPPERLGLPVPAAPVARVVEPRLDRHEIHLEAMAEQRRLMRSQESR
jgi:hypothetical protein